MTGHDAVLSPFHVSIDSPHVNDIRTFRNVWRNGLDHRTRVLEENVMINLSSAFDDDVGLNEVDFSLNTANIPVFFLRTFLRNLEIHWTK